MLHWNRGVIAVTRALRPGSWLMVHCSRLPPLSQVPLHLSQTARSFTQLIGQLLYQLLLGLTIQLFIRLAVLLLTRMLPGLDP